MDKFIFIFPLLFIFHDMEEIIGFGTFLKKNMPKIEKRAPKVAGVFKKMLFPYSTDGMALAVFEILILCIVITVVSLILNTYQLYIGVFIAYIIHLFVHILQAIAFKGYVPSLLTSIICIPVSLFVLKKMLDILNYSTPEIIIWSVAGLIVVLLNVKIAHLLMSWFTKKYIEK